MSVVWVVGRDWQPRVSEDDDGSVASFRFPPELTFNRAALDQLIDQANLLYGGAEPDIEFDGDQVTTTLMAQLYRFAQDRLIPGLFPVFRSNWSKALPYEHYPFIVLPTTEQLLSEGNIFDLRRLMTVYVPTVKQRYVAIAREITVAGPVTTWEFTDFEWQQAEDLSDATFSHFGYSDNVDDWLFMNTPNTLVTVITEPGVRTVEVGVFTKLYQDFLSNYWDQQQGLEEVRDYDFALEETDDEYKLTFSPVDQLEDEQLTIQLHFDEPLSVDKELPGRILLGSEPIELSINRGQVGAVRAAGFINCNKIASFQLDSEEPFIEDFYLEGGQVVLRADGYISSGPGTTTSPHKLVIEFDRPIEGEITLRLKIDGHPVGRTSAINAFVITTIDQDVVIDMDGGNDNDFLDRFELEINAAKTQVKLKFIPVTEYNPGVGLFLRLGSAHETPVLYSVGGVEGCIGQRTIEHVAIDAGDGVDLEA